MKYKLDNYPSTGIIVGFVVCVLAGFVSPLIGVVVGSAAVFYMLHWALMSCVELADGLTRETKKYQQPDPDFPEPPPIQHDGLRS